MDISETSEQHATPAQRVETVAQLVHLLYHRAGTANSCDKCSETAKQIDELYRSN